jgi:hypothetical protein
MPSASGVLHEQLEHHPSVHALVGVKSREPQADVSPFD